MKTMDKKPAVRPRRFRYGLPGIARSQALNVQCKQIGQILRKNTLQTRLTIGQPNDKYEKQADHVANQVMSMPDQKVQLREAPEEEEEVMQAKSSDGQTSNVSPNLEDRIQSLTGRGQPLPSSERKFFEPRLGVSLGGVRIHTDASAVRIANSINAKAFTRGSDMVFGAGQLAPGTYAGRKLLGHELTHVVQQGATAPGVTRTPLPKATPWVQRKNKPTATVTCSYRSSLSAPKDDELVKRLVAFKVLRPKGPSTDFDNILYRHIKAGTGFGKEYLKFMRANAYPMKDFCIAYGGKGWNKTFNKVKKVYGIVTPRNHAMQLVSKAVRSYDRINLFMYDENVLYTKVPSPKGGGKTEVIRDPFARPLTPRRLRRKKKGTILHGSAIEASLLQKATDEFLTSKTMTVAQIKATALMTTFSGSSRIMDIFSWGTAKEEGTKKDPNRFDAEIVHWVNHYNLLYRPLDKKGKSNHLDPDLFKALIWVESKFEETASAAPRSSALGLTQVLKRERGAVGSMTAGVSGITKKEFLGSPSLQVAVGVRILFEKYRRSKNWRTAVRDYNGGPKKDVYEKEVFRVYKSHRRS